MIPTFFNIEKLLLSNFYPPSKLLSLHHQKMNNEQIPKILDRRNNDCRWNLFDDESKYRLGNCGCYSFCNPDFSFL